MWKCAEKCGNGQKNEETGRKYKELEEKMCKQAEIM